jgi:hypothetical protein
VIGCDTADGGSGLTRPVEGRSQGSSGFLAAAVEKLRASSEAADAAGRRASEWSKGGNLANQGHWPLARIEKKRSKIQAVWIRRPPLYAVGVFCYL